MIKVIFELVKNQVIDKGLAQQLIEKVTANQGQVIEGTQQQFDYGENYVRDHQVLGERLVLGVTHCSLALNAFSDTFNEGLVGGLKNISFLAPVRISEGERAKVRLNIFNIGPDYNTMGFNAEYALEKSADKNNNPWCVTAKGEFIPALGKSPSLDLKGYLEEPVKDFYEGKQVYLQMNNVAYGESLYTIDQISQQGNRTLSKLSVKQKILGGAECFLCHPAILDGALLATMAPFLFDKEQKTFIPFFIENLFYYHRVGDSVICAGEITSQNNELIKCNFTLCDESGEVLLEIKGFTCKRVKDSDTLLKSIRSSAMAGHGKEQGSNNEAASAQPSNSVNRLSGGKAPVNKDLSDSDKSLLHEKVISYVSNLLGQKIPDSTVVVESEKNFMELGLDSATLVDVASEIENGLGIELYPTTFFEYQNLFDLTNYLLDEHMQPILKHFALDLPSQAPQRTPSEITQDPPAEVQTPGPATQVGYKDIAVIGMSGVFAESDDLAEFWQHLEQGSDLMSEIPQTRFNYREWYDQEDTSSGKIYCKWGSFIRDVDKFDADFFNIGQREAEVMDPQLRHLLQTTYLAAEDAGYGDKLRGSNTGVYVGCCFYDYQAQMLADGKPIEVYDGIGNSPTMLANRQSFFFDLRGPSLTVDTACSSSLVALHLACQALQRGECDNAMVSGANLLLTPSHYQYFCQLGALGRAGRCHTFDAQADGYIPGEGIATIMLKPFERALTDNDQIYGVIKGSAIKHGGHASSVTAPNVKGEEEVIIQAWQQANIDPATIDYIEAHGTGTALGDPIEFQATEKALRRYCNAEKFCAIGSAKAHVGHLEGAAGITGVIKVLLAMRNQKIPAMPKFENLNPYIKAAKSPLYINTEVLDWNVNGRPRRAGVNSFGFGGTFVHVLLEDFERKPQLIPPDTNTEQMIVLSAKNQSQLLKKAESLVGWLKGQSNICLADLAYTLQTGRETMACRMVLVCRHVSQLQHKLESFLADKPCDNLFIGQKGDDPHQIAKIFDVDKGLSNALSGYVKQTPNLAHLAQLWILGIKLDWSLLHESPRRLLGLPGHNFIKESYWYKPITLFDAASEVLKIVNAGNFEIQQKETFIADFTVLESLSINGLWSYLQAWGLFESMAKKPIDLDNLLVQYKILPKYKRFIAFIFKKMCGHEFLVMDGQGYRLSKKGKKINSDVDQFTVDCQRIIDEHPSLENHVKLLAHCLNNLKVCLIGDKAATEILFTDDSLALVENIYTNNAIAHHLNDKVAYTVVEYAKILAQHQKKIKIVEIGAGTGGTSRHIFSELNKYPHLSDCLEYHYTDISVRFLEHAEQNFLPENAYIKTKRLDIEKGDQIDSDLLGADVVVASNVLHATREINHTLTNIHNLVNGKSLVKGKNLVEGKSALLVINELTREQSFLSLCFGLLDGWWLYKDEQNRIPHSPLLSVDHWQECLATAGFTFIDNNPDKEIGQNVLIALAQPDWKTSPQIIQKNNLAESPRKAIKPEVKSAGTLYTILQIISEIIRQDISDINPEDYFMDIGMDSLKGVEFQEKLNLALGTKLKTIVILNYPTAKQLAEYIDKEVLSETVNENTEFGRYKANAILAEELRQQKQLKGKTHIDKLFELPEQPQEEPQEDFLRKVFNKEKVNIDLIETRNGRMEVVSAGDQGDVVILLSPLNSLSVVWHNQFELLAKKYRVVCCHYPGFGRSEFRSGIYNIHEIGETILEALDRLNLNGQFHLFGWSMGGLIAQSICGRHPERVRSLALMGTGTISMFDDDYYNEHTHIKEILEQELAASEFVHPALIADHNLLVGTYNTEVLIHYAQIIRDFNHTEKKRFELPVLVINGADDKVLLPKYAEALAENIEDSIYKEIKNAGHFIALTHPRKVDWHLRRFWSQAKKNTEFRRKQ